MQYLNLRGKAQNHHRQRKTFLAQKWLQVCNHSQSKIQPSLMTTQYDAEHLSSLFPHFFPSRPVKSSIFTKHKTTKNSHWQHSLLLVLIFLVQRSSKLVEWVQKTELADPWSKQRYLLHTLCYWSPIADEPEFFSRPWSLTLPQR